MKPLLIGMAIIGLLLGWCPIASAQTKPINPGTVEVNPATADYGQIARLEIAFFAVGATQPVSAPLSLGKPPLTATGCTAPVVDPCVRTSINTMPVPFGLDYTAKVRAVAVVAGTDIFSEWSVASNPFDRAPGPPSKPVIK